MPNVIPFFRDALGIDQSLISSLSPRPGDTLVFAARQVTLFGLLSAYNYVIAADELNVTLGAATSLIGVEGNPTPAVTVLAIAIQGPLHILCAGLAGRDGFAGEDGTSGFIDEQNPKTAVPGGDGGNGEAGSDGAPGGSIILQFGSASETPTGTAPGGSAGRGGKGGAAGPGKPRGKRGKDGRPGKRGRSGQVQIRQVEPLEVWNVLDADSAAGWAAYRAEVAGFFFRKFDPGSQLTALDETRAALLLNPADADAAAIQSRIVNRQTPSGLSRDLDIAPDFPDLAANLTAEIAVVQGAFASYVSVVSLETIAESIRENLSVMRTQLADRKLEAQGNVLLAQQDVEIAKAEKANIQAQIDDVQKQIDAVRERRFGFGGIISDVGSIAGVVAGLATGVGAIISIPAGLAALQRVADGQTLGLLLGELKNAAKDPKHKTAYEEDVAKAKNLGSGLEDLIKGVPSMVSFVKVVSDLEGALSLPGQSETAKLLKQQALLVRQKMVGALRETQARSRVAVAELRVNNLIAEIAEIEDKLNHWTGEIAALTAATDILIRSARDVVDMVMEDVFLAQRAREIYELDDISNLHFDFGFIHPDQDHGLGPAQRASASLTSLAGFAIQVLSFNKIFQRLNTAQIGFDVIHPQLSVTITDSEQLRAFANGAGLNFAIALADVPQKMFELKVNAMSLEMTGASSVESSNIFITHSGDWTISRRTDGSIATLSLRPRSEVFGFGTGTGKLTATIPAHPQSSAEPGPPFSFWGRGVATTIKLQIALPSTMNLSALSSIHITVDCIGYAPQGAGALPRTKTIKPAVRLTGPAPSIPRAAAARAHRSGNPHR